MESVVSVSYNSLMHTWNGCRWQSVSCSCSPCSCNASHVLLPLLNISTSCRCGSFPRLHPPLLLLLALCIYFCQTAVVHDDLVTSSFQHLCFDFITVTSSLWHYDIITWHSDLIMHHETMTLTQTTCDTLVSSCERLVSWLGNSVYCCVTVCSGGDE